MLMSVFAIEFIFANRCDRHLSLKTRAVDGTWSNRHWAKLIAILSERRVSYYPYTSTQIRRESACSNDRRPRLHDAQPALSAEVSPLVRQRLRLEQPDDPGAAVSQGRR